MLASLAALLLATAPQEQAPSSQLDDVVVAGRRAEALAREFVAGVAAPTNRRGLARWNTPLCVGVANLRADAAQAIVDRISDVADSLGVQIGAPGCRANALIVATDDGAALARGMVESYRRTFDAGSTQMNQSDRDLELFQSQQRPVRWWQVSTPTNSDTGERAVRLAGDVDDMGNPAAPIVSSLGSRLNSNIRDDMSRVIIIADIDDITGLSTTQLADYFAMVTLAQIGADAETGQFDTVLNLFDERETVTGLTEWDLTYLEGLYTASQRRINGSAQAGAVASAAARRHRERAREAEAAEAEGQE